MPPTTLKESTPGVEASTSSARRAASLVRARYDDFDEMVGGVAQDRAGNRPANVPRRTANLWLSKGFGQQVEAGIGARYVDERYADTANTQSAPGYTVVDGYAVKVLAISPILVDYMGNAARVLLLAPVALRDRAETARLWRAQWRGALGVAVFSPIAYVLVLYAVQQAPLSHVAPAREVSMLFAALIGGHLLKEGDRAARIAGAVLIAVGVTALGLG